MIFSGCINEVNAQKKPLYVAAFDVPKSIDEVDHASLLRKLYFDGIACDNWLLLKTNILYYLQHTLSLYWFYEPVISLPM